MKLNKADHAKFTNAVWAALPKTTEHSHDRWLVPTRYGIVEVKTFLQIVGISLQFAQPERAQGVEALKSNVWFTRPTVSGAWSILPQTPDAFVAALKELARRMELLVAPVEVTPPNAIPAPVSPKSTPTTVTGWLETLPDGYRELALANYAKHKQRGNNHCPTLLDAFVGLSAERSREGAEFWHRVQAYYVAQALPPLSTDS